MLWCYVSDLLFFWDILILQCLPRRTVRTFKFFIRCWPLYTVRSLMHLRILQMENQSVPSNLWNLNPSVTESSLFWKWWYNFDAEMFSRCKWHGVSDWVGLKGLWAKAVWARMNFCWSATSNTYLFPTLDTFFFPPGATTPIGGCILQPYSGL